MLRKSDKFQADEFWTEDLDHNETIPRKISIFFFSAALQLGGVWIFSSKLQRKPLRTTGWKSCDPCVTNWYTFEKMLS